LTIRADLNLCGLSVARDVELRKVAGAEGILVVGEPVRHLHVRRPTLDDHLGDPLAAIAVVVSNESIHGNLVLLRPLGELTLRRVRCARCCNSRACRRWRGPRRAEVVSILPGLPVDLRLADCILAVVFGNL
jgi:hypothetical protein